MFTREELIAQFALEGISGGNAVFNQEKLDWVNAQHVARLSAEVILGAMRERPRIAWALVGHGREFASRVARSDDRAGEAAREEGERLHRAARTIPARARGLRSGGCREAPAN